MIGIKILKTLKIMEVSYMRRMIIILSHKLTEEQINDAKEHLGVEEFIYLPKSLQKLWSNIPPDIDDYLKPIKNFLENNTKPDDYVLVQGDFGATYKIVNFALDKNLIPVYATTKRIAKDIYDGRKTITIREFKHCKFRRY